MKVIAYYKNGTFNNDIPDVKTYERAIEIATKDEKELEFISDIRFYWHPINKRWETKDVIFSIKLFYGDSIVLKGKIVELLNFELSQNLRFVRVEVGNSEYLIKWTDILDEDVTLVFK